MQVVVLQILKSITGYSSKSYLEILFNDLYIQQYLREHVYSKSGIKARKVIWHNLITGALPLQIAQRTNDVTVTNLQFL